MRFPVCESIHTTGHEVILNFIVPDNPAPILHIEANEEKSIFSLGERLQLP